MRFNRYPRTTMAEATPRRLAAARRAVNAEKDKYALFPEFVRHKTAEERVAAIQRHTVVFWDERRNDRAHSWRTARRQLRELPDLTRRGVLAWWQRGGVPGCPEYLLGAIREAKRGVSYWGRLAELKRLALIGAGRLPRPASWKTITSNAGVEVFWICGVVAALPLPQPP